jgi:ABC-type Fe3+-hydroxamate transport system substrate-binding protein
MFLNEVHETGGPVSIVSLVPSQTELLYDLGLDKEVTGITKFCVHPAHWQQTKVRIGGTKNLNLAKIKSLNPTLIIANKEENVRSQVEQLSDYPVWLTDVNNLEDACRMISDLGQITGVPHQAAAMVKKIADGFDKLGVMPTPIPVAYLIWKDPYMTVGGDTFIHDMITRTGMRNVFAHTRRYPEINLEDIKKSGCTFLLLSSEPFPFQQ